MFGELASWLAGAVGQAAHSLFDAGGGAEDEEEEDSGLVDLQCGRTVFNDVPAKMRTELWLSQLHREQGAGAAAAARFASLARQPLPDEVVAEIEKDTHRTFPGHAALSGRAGQRSMLRVLRAYAALDPEVGYTQGMNFLAGLLLAYLEEADAFGALALVMTGRGLRELYRPDGMALLQARLWQLGRLAPPRLAAHMEAAAALPVLYAPSWFLTCFAADFPLSFAARVMDLVITDCYAAPLMKVAVHVLERCEAELLGSDDMEAMVELLRRGVPRWPRAALHDLLTEALGRPWTARQAAVLAEINGAETVIDAVRRVDAAAAGRAAAEAGGAAEPRGEAPAGGGPAAAAGGGPASPGKLTPLPPPPGSRRERVEWERWRPATPALAAAAVDSLRIEPELREARLDPSLSAALSSYAPAHASQHVKREGELASRGEARPAPGGPPPRWAPPATPPAAPPALPLPSPFASEADLIMAPAAVDGCAAAPADSSASTPSGWGDEFGSFRAASSELPPAQDEEGARTPAASRAVDSSAMAHLVGALRLSGKVGRAPAQQQAAAAEFGSWMGAAPELSPGEAKGAGGGRPSAAAGSDRAPPGTPLADSDPMASLVSPLQSATSKALLLQHAHLQEFLSATKAPRAPTGKPDG